MSYLINFKIVDQLTKILGNRPNVPQMKQMMVQLSDLRHFITVIPSSLLPLNYFSLSRQN